MLKSYLTIAIRNILRHRTYSFINVSGLAVGLACVILISMYLGHEWTYDAFHENKDTIYRVVQRTKYRAGEYSYPSNSALPLGPALREEFPEVTQYLRYQPRSNMIVRSADDAHFQRVLFADPTLLKMFTFPLVAGHPESVLSNPGSIVITSELAQVFFGEEPPLGKRLTLEIREVWEEIMPNQPFQYSFLDEDLAALYGDESRWTSIVTSSSIAAILIASMGLFGLASLAAERRTKEIGIRKVVGASVGQLVTLLSREFLVLVLIANVIAWPIAWYAMNRWLENFAYRIDLGVGTFILAGLLALVIALVTVSVQAIKAATANPVEALRYE